MSTSKETDFDVRIRDIDICTRTCYGSVRNFVPWTAFREGRELWGVMCQSRGSTLFQYREGGVDKLSAGEIAILSPTLAYRSFPPIGSSDCDWVTINFLLEGNLEALVDAKRMCVMRPDNFSHYQNAFDECWAAWQTRQAGYKMLIIGTLYRILYELLSLRIRKNPDSEAHRQTESAVEYMKEHIAEALNIQTLARTCGLSETHFRRQFQKAYRQSPIAYLLGMRLERAKELLLRGECGIDEIALRTGFRNVNYFIRYFKQHVGMTPKQYRVENANQTVILPRKGDYMEV